MTSTRADDERAQKLDQLLDGAIAAGVGVLMVVGFVVSWATLSHLAVTVGHFPKELAWAVPLSFDLGIVVLSLKVVRAAREGRTAPILRLLVVALSLATVVVNAAAGSSVAGKLLHVVPVAMFVVAFESVVASTRRHALVRLGLVPVPLPRVRGVRWLLAPRSTFLDWREVVLARDLFESPISKPTPSFAKSGSKATAPVVPDAPVVGAAKPVDPQKPRVAPVAAPVEEGGQEHAPRPSRQAMAEEIARLCVEPSDVIPKARPILKAYGVTGKTAERVRADARAIVAERLAEVLEAVR